MTTMPLLPLPPHRADHRPGRRRALAWLGAWALGADARAQTAAPPASGGFDLAQLMRLLGQVQAGEASFVETRTVAMLERTLQSQGRLSFAAPDTFVRETLSPRREKVAVVGNTVTMSLGSRSRSVPLDSVPEAAVIMEALRGTLTGNRAAIERHFTAVVGGSAQRWTLELKPLEPRLRELVISVKIAGAQALVREVAVAMADGDRSVMAIEPAAPGASGAAAPRAVGASAPN